MLFYVDIICLFHGGLHSHLNILAIIFNGFLPLIYEIQSIKENQKAGSLMMRHVGILSVTLMIQKVALFDSDL